MSNEPNVTVVGNLGGDPELRFLPSGVPVVNFSIVQTPRTKSGDDWIDGEPIWFRCTAWREAAEHIAESLQKGQRVIALGRMKVEKYTPRDGGEERTSIVLDVDEIGHTLRWGTSQFTRAQQGGSQQPAQSRQPQGQQQRPAQQRSQQQRPAPANEDPWGTPTGYDEPPY